ncbi:Uncharacterised protein [Mycobacteroides abscessus subsp. abscessus]|nr:Uncharacterised protein [Mycobacteroides abscessus subsp. abscessus]
MYVTEVMADSVRFLEQKRDISSQKEAAKV